jgi:hypothetical protein
MGAAEPRHIARAGVVPLLLCRSAGSDQNQRNDEKKSGHLVTPSYPMSAPKAF